MVRVLFFASLRDAVGVDEVSLPIGEPLAFDRFMAELKTALSAGAYAAICGENVRVAINQELVDGVKSVSAGDEIAFLPPVTGG